MADTEVRLALVMNGGVSLAVWIAGVTHEIDLIRRATLDHGTGHLKPRDEPVAARWRELLLPDDGTERRRVVVDVLAGTSAGGLNATMLATAIAHDGTIDPDFTADELGPTAEAEGPWLREVWCTLGALRREKLLPQDTDQDTGSVLDGGFFLREAQGIMAKLGQGTATSTHPVTLYTTASGMGTQSYTATDAADQKFDVADHRFVYRFSTDKPWDYDPAGLRFAPPTNPRVDFEDPERLALAARASASFPVAFQPVRELESMNAIPPRQRPTAAGKQPSWLMDGGVLDNAPFGPVLDTVAKGALAGKVDRYVVYVVPSAGIGKAATAVGPAESTAPSWLTTVGSAIQYPREVDFRSDVEDLARLRVEADTAWSDTQRLYERAVGDDVELRNLLAAAALLQPTYTLGRAAGAVWEAITVGEAGRVTPLDKDAAAPANAAEILARLPRCTPGTGFPVQTLTSGEHGEPLWPWGLGPAERVARTVLRSTRTQLDRTLRAVADGTQAQDDQETLEVRLDTLSTSRTRIFSLRAAVGSAISEEYERLSAAAGDGLVAAGLRRPDALAVADAIEHVFGRLRVQEALGQEIASLQRDLGPDGDRLLQAALAVEIVSRCTSARTPDQRSVPFAFVRLGPDVELPVLDDAGRALARRLGNRVLYGTQVAHFGAFGADDWRRWDWLMGRLHAVAHLGLLLHDSTTPEEHDRAVAWVAETQRAVLEAEGTGHTELTDRLSRLEQDYPVTSLRYGAARLVEAMNDADRQLAADQMATRQIGERLVAVSDGLGSQPARWVRAVVGLEEPVDITTVERVGRWLATPVRATAWSTVTDGRTTSPQPTGWPLQLFSVLPWALSLVLGIGMIVVGCVVVDDAPAVGIVLACVGAALGLVGGVGLAAVRWLTGLRDRAGRRFSDLLGRWLPDRVTRG